MKDFTLVRLVTGVCVVVSRAMSLLCPDFVAVIVQVT